MSAGVLEGPEAIGEVERSFSGRYLTGLLGVREVAAAGTTLDPTDSDLRLTLSMGVQMDDPVLQAYLTDFSSAHGLTDVDESAVFEYFSAYCVYLRDFSEHVVLDDVVVAGGLDTAIDAVGMFLNDIPVTSPAQVDEISSRQRIEVDFAFIQAKTSRALNAAEIGNYIQGVKEFFGNRYQPANEQIAEKRFLSDHIFLNSVKMRGRPRLSLYYCYAGNYKSDPVIEARAKAGCDEIRAYNLFSEVAFEFLDANRLQERYQEANLRIEREVRIDEYASLPTINGIKQAYIGVLPCNELVKLLSNSDGRLHKSLFNENVRDYLSRNPVNDEIADTIRSVEAQGRLAALNNGITIVAKDIKIVGKNFTLSDYQVVNGCQTSHIIFEYQGLLHDSTSVPVKIIQAEDRELVNEIVRATNRQTEVKDEAFTVLSEFHKRLERFFASAEAESEFKLVYERRKRQYADTAFTAQNVVTITFLTNAFVSCILENPVDSIDYYGVLLHRYNQQMYVDGHSLWPYLLSAVIIREIEKLCVGRARPVLWKFRFIIGLLIRKKFGQLPDLRNEKAWRQYASKAIEICHDKTKFRELVRQAEVTLADAVIQSGPDLNRANAQQNRKFVDSVIQSAS